jgi:hypothetical protein
VDKVETTGAAVVAALYPFPRFCKKSNKPGAGAARAPALRAKSEREFFIMVASKMIVWKRTTVVYQ